MLGAACSLIQLCVRRHLGGPHIITVACAVPNVRVSPVFGVPGRFSNLRVAVLREGHGYAGWAILDARASPGHHHSGMLKPDLDASTGYSK